MKKAPKIRYNGNIALIHTREDIDVLMKAHNQMADIVNELINIVEKQKEKKPIIKYEQTHDCLTEIEWKCPTCGTNYIELAPCGEWCRYCGTKLDWSDEE